MAVATEIEEKQSAFGVLPFTVEVDLPRNGHLIVQSIPGRTKLRSRFDPHKPVKFGGDGPQKDDDVIPRDQNNTFSTHPKLPGQRIHVNPEEMTYEITDPLHDNKELCEKLQRWLETNNVVGNGKRNGFPPVSGTLDKHRIKTLCRELYYVVENGDGRIVEGGELDLNAIDNLPGNYLLNPGSTIRTSQPKFEKDLPTWEEKLNAMGG